MKNNINWYNIEQKHRNITGRKRMPEAYQIRGLPLINAPALFTFN